jgi:hypothetical protein
MPRRESRAKQARLNFGAMCIAEVMPAAREDRQPKRILFRQAAMFGVERSDCPRMFRHSPRKLERYLRNHWKLIRLMLPANHDILPCYVNGPAFGGGGYHAGNLRLARRQQERDERVAQGIVDSVDAFANATNRLFPQVAAPRRILVTRAARS